MVKAKARVLVITRSNVISHFCPVLKKNGFKVDLVNEDGLGIDRAVQQNPDVIIVGEEVGRPGYAEAVISEILTWRMKAKIVVIFAENRPQLVEGAKKAGAMAVITIGGNVSAAETELLKKLECFSRSG